MTKGKFGINLTTIAVIAFAFAAFQNPMAVLLVAGFALLAERDEWLCRQTVQALLLNLVYSGITLVIGWIFGRLVWFLAQVEVYKAAKFFSDAEGYVTGTLYVTLTVLCVFAIIRVAKGQEANIPLLSKMAGGDVVGALTQSAPPVPQYAPAAPQPILPVWQQEPIQQQAPVQLPVAPPTPRPAPQIQETVAQPEPAVPQGNFCAECGNPLDTDAMFCNECGAKQ